MKLSASVFEIDFKTYLRSTVLALLLIVDALIGRLRTIPPFSLAFIFVILSILSIWLLWRTKHKRGIPDTPITFPLTIYLIAVAISTIFSVDPRRSLEGLIATCAVVLFFFIICDLLTSGWKVETLEIAMLIFFTYLIIHGLWMIFNWFKLWYTLQVPEYPPFLLGYRLFGVSAWPSKLVMLINAGIPFVVFRMYRSNSFLKKILWGLWLLAAIIVFYYADTRGGYVALIFILAITIGWLLYSKRVFFRENPFHWLKVNRNILIVFAVYVGIFALISLTNSLISPHSGYTRHGGGITAGRIDFWRVAIDIIRNYPLTGSGPMTYPRFYIQELPGGINGWISPHAHNLLLNTTSQLGILGLFALGSIIISLVLVLIRSKEIRSLILFKSQDSQSYLLVGVIAALIGFLIQSMFDRLEEIPHTMFCILLLLGIGLYILNQIKVHEKSNTYSSFILILLMILISGVINRQYSAYASQLNSLQSGYERNWKEAAENIESALDYDPKLNFYYEQGGYALGALALSSETSHHDKTLEVAIDKYRVGINGFPYWAPNYVNLAELLYQAGKPKESLATLESIPKKWFQVWPFLPFFLADKYNSLGYFSEAEELFKYGLDQRVWMKESAICKLNEICKGIAIQSQFEDNGIYSTHEEAINKVHQGFPDEAITLLEAIPPAESSSLIWIDRAAAHLALNELPQSEYALEVADRLGILNHPVSNSLYALTKAKLLLRKQKSNEAIDILESVVRPKIRIRNYENLVYQRIGFPNPLLPSLTILEQNKFDILVYSLLADLYRENGDINGAEWAMNQASNLSVLLEIE